MKRETFEKLTLAELCDQLVANTLLLLEATDKKSDAIAIRDLKQKVELLQEIIRKKRMERIS
jgi:hypothetical protein